MCATSISVPPQRNPVEGRYKSTLIDSNRYLLTCCRYIELNPVRAAMVAHPGDYPWSSFRGNAAGSGRAEPLTAPAISGPGDSPAARGRAYRALFDRHLDSQAVRAIREATEAGAVLGNNRFKEEIEAVLNRRVVRLPHGGDRKSETFRERQKGPVG